MAPFLVAGDMVRNADHSILLADYVQPVTADKADAVRMFREEVAAMATLLDKANVKVLPLKRTSEGLADAWVHNLPRPSKLRRTDVFSETTIMTTG